MPDDDQAQTQLRERVLDEIMAFDGAMVLGDGSPVSHDQMKRILLKADEICEFVVTGGRASDEKSHQMAINLRQQFQELSAMPRFQPNYRVDRPNTFGTHFLRHWLSYINQTVASLFNRQAAFSSDAPCIIVKTLIVPGDQTKEGTLVKGVSALWFEIMRMIQADPDSIHHIDWRKWEEIVAGAYNQEGWEVVVLTPGRGDKGRDIIAQRKDWGQLRFLLLDQVKSYAPDHLVGPDEIREMAGVLHREQGATKGIITTTSGFTPGALEEAEYLYPRLELKPREKLLPWLASVAVEDLQASSVSEAGEKGDG